MIYKLELKDFRLFENQSIYLGKYVTILAGRNSTGKSTVLGLLANSGELKKKDGVSINGKAFRADFSEIFKANEKFEKSKSNRIRLNILDEQGVEKDYRWFRTSWQTKENEDVKRFRIIPYKVNEDGSRNEAKFNFPVIYLGLSRLYPLGEVDTKISQENLNNLTSEDLNWFKDNYFKILCIHDKIVSIEKYKVESSRKNGVATTTDKYDYLTNSSGQDNIGQILLAILSLKKLFVKNENVKDGLLLIDEMDASLHPAAQKKLFDLLVSESKRVGFQVVFTTHSSDLLKHASPKIQHNTEAINNIELYYFSTANRILNIKRNLEYSIIEGDLSLSSIVQNNNKVKVYSEDAETRWLFEKIIKEYRQYLNILDVTIGCEELLHIMKADMGYFSNCLCVFDGDVTNAKIKDYIPDQIRNKTNNILVLPGSCNPESLLYSYIMDLQLEHPFWEEAEKYNLSFDYFSTTGSPECTEGNNQREKDKRWFNDHKSMFESLRLFEYWEQDNQDTCEVFKRKFIECYNAIATRTFNFKIQ